MFYRSIVILILLNFSCYASPIPSINQHERAASIINAIQHQSDMKEPMVSKIDDELLPLQNLHQYEFMKILCEFYAHCNDDDIDDEQQPIDYYDSKHKRLSSGVFHGIPKFGKRAFSSAFSGIPKFG
jgi:hypothetical protein